MISERQQCMLDRSENYAAVHEKLGLGLYLILRQKRRKHE